MNQLQVISDIVGECSKSQIESVFAPAMDLSTTCNVGPKIENIKQIKKPVLSWLINRLND